MNAICWRGPTRLLGGAKQSVAPDPADPADPHDGLSHGANAPALGPDATQGDSPRAVDVAGLGRVVLYLPQRLSSAALDLLVALTAANEGLTVLAGSCGNEDADAPVAAGVRRLGGPAAWQPPAVPAPAPTRIIAVPDADEEVRTALRGVVEAMRRGVPLEQMAVLYGRNDPYARLLADQLRAAELPFNGPTARPLTESVLGRFLLGLLGLPGRRYSRLDVMAWLAAAPIPLGAGGRRGWALAAGARGGLGAGQPPRRGDRRSRGVGPAARGLLRQPAVGDRPARRGQRLAASTYRARSRHRRQPAPLHGRRPGSWRSGKRAAIVAEAHPMGREIGPGPGGRRRVAAGQLATARARCRRARRRPPSSVSAAWIASTPGPICRGSAAPWRPNLRPAEGGRDARVTVC